MTHEVYISYDEADSLAAEAICHVLEENDIKCWIKSRDAGRKHIVEEVTEAIRNSEVMILIFSNTSKSSNFVNTEVDIGFSSNISMIIYKIDNSSLDGALEFFLKNKHWLDAYPNPSSQFERLIMDTAYLLEKPLIKPKISPNEVYLVDKKINKKLIFALGLIPIIVFAIGIIMELFSKMNNISSTASLDVGVFAVVLAIILWLALIIYVLYKKNYF